MKQQLAAALLLAVAVTVAANQTNLTFAVPRLEKIVVDGKADDWGTNGFRVAVLSSAYSASDLSAGFRLGWSERGLLLLLTLADDAVAESDNPERLWERDSVEVFLATQRGGTDAFQVVIAPSQARFHLNDQRKSAAVKDVKLAAEVARSGPPTNSTVELLLPWANLGIEPKRGREVAFQIYVNDTDGSDRKQVTWFPSPGAHKDTKLMYRLRLAEHPSAALLAKVSGQYEQFRRTRLSIAAAVELAGRSVEIADGQRTLATAQLQERGTVVELPMPARGQPYGVLTVRDGKQTLATLELPDADKERARAFMEAKLSFPRVFSGEQFPKPEFEQPLLVEELIGRYQIKTTYYSRDHQPVGQATKPGRYGAVIEIAAADGRVFRRYRTLFRLPTAIRWWETELGGKIQLPTALEIAPVVVEDFNVTVREALKWALVDGLRTDNGAAALFTGMYEAKPLGRVPSVYEDAEAADRQWWVEQKLILYARKAEPFTGPKKLEGTPARVLRTGTAQEAGMKPGATDKIAAVCREWAANSDQAFNVCVARHGVIVLHDAYGQRDGQPMTVTNKSWVASNTKTISGALLMMLVEAGRVRLDTPVENFLPVRGMQMRHLYTHTAGMWGHWGDELPDLEELVAGYPYFEPGKYEYNGMSLALGGKIIEAVTGEALPQCYQRHLLDPLGCEHTDITDSSGGARSTAHDMAKIAQMLLNRGAYGQWRFMSENTFTQMLPRRLTDILGPDTTVVQGIGLTAFDREGLGAGTFGHGSASMCTLRIDPTNDLVITMTRNAAGKNFDQYHRQFLATIIENLAERP